MTRHYPTPGAFKQALEQRLKNSSETGTDFARRRQLLVFDRLLARIMRREGDAVVLKGGLVLELRLDRARTTKDVDLRWTGSPGEVLNRLQRAGDLDLGDYMRFEIERDPAHPDIRAALPYEGTRFRAECRLAGAIYGRPFGIDVAFGDPLVGEPDRVVAQDLLDFAGISPPEIRLYPVVSHLAEKVHALTFPRERPNSRIRDLPDIALLATTGPIDGRELREALHLTFGFRATHSLPHRIPDPPDFWADPYAAMAKENSLRWESLSELISAVAAFVDPVLGAAEISVWSPGRWRWT